MVIICQLLCLQLVVMHPSGQKCSNGALNILSVNVLLLSYWTNVKFAGKMLCSVVNIIFTDIMIVFIFNDFIIKYSKYYITCSLS